MGCLEIGKGSLYLWGGLRCCVKTGLARHSPSDSPVSPWAAATRDSQRWGSEGRKPVRAAPDQAWTLWQVGLQITLTEEVKPRLTFCFQDIDKQQAHVILNPVHTLGPKQTRTNISTCSWPSNAKLNRLVEEDGNVSNPMSSWICNVHLRKVIRSCLATTRSCKCFCGSNV